MKKVLSVTLRMFIATALSISFLIYSPLRLSSVGAATRVVADLRSESQYRIEASRYDDAIRAIASVSSMKLENPDELKKALAIFDREGPQLKFHGSKLIVLGLNDSTFTASVKKASPDQAAAEALIKELRADPKAILKLNGAQSLVTRLRQSTEADAATLRRVAERFKEAAAKYGRSDNGNQIGEALSDMLTRVGDFLGFIIILAALVDLSDKFALADFFAKFLQYLLAFEACMEAADRKRAQCVTDARKQTNPNLGAEARCFSNLEVQIALCEITAAKI